MHESISLLSEEVEKLLLVVGELLNNLNLHHSVDYLKVIVQLSHFNIGISRTKISGLLEQIKSEAQGVDDSDVREEQVTIECDLPNIDIKEEDDDSENVYHPTLSKMPRMETVVNIGEKTKSQAISVVPYQSSSAPVRQPARHPPVTSPTMRLECYRRECILCNLTFGSNQEFLSHFDETHFVVGAFNCSFRGTYECKFSSNDKVTAVQHIFVQHKFNCYLKCPHCPDDSVLFYLSNSELKNHLAEVHEIEVTPNTCPICSEEFKKTDKKHAAENHMDTHTEMLYQCQICESDKTWNNRGNCRHHYKNHHEKIRQKKSQAGKTN